MAWRACRAVGAIGSHTVAEVDEITFSVVDAASQQARWAMGRYFDELERRFSQGFDSSHAFDEAAVGLNPPRGVFVIACADGTTIGCGGIQCLDDDTAEIKRMWVDPRWRGVGVGKRLLGHLEDEVRRLGCARVVLDTNESLTEAIALYGRLGYVPIDRYSDNPYAHHWFEKSIGSADQ
jgi:GNAT superfamily N-acetyltransferase